MFELHQDKIASEKRIELMLEQHKQDMCEAGVFRDCTLHVRMRFNYTGRYLFGERYQLSSPIGEAIGY
jgi:hypothetical protein